MRNKLGLVIISISLFATPWGLQAQEREESSVMSLSGVSGKLTTTFFSFASVENMLNSKKAKEVADEGKSLSSYNYIGLNYKRNQDSKISLRVPFLFQTEGVNKYGDNEKQEVGLSDIHVAYSMYDLGYIGDIDISGNVKYYFPTSPYSQMQKSLGKVRFEGFFEYHLTRFSSVTWVVKPEIYLQTQTAYFNEDTAQYPDGGYVKDPRSTTKQYSLEHYVEVLADINKHFSLKPKAGFDEDWYYGSVSEGLESSHVTKVKFGLGLEVRPFRNLNMTFGIENETALGSYRGKDHQFFLPENNTYFVMTNLFLFNI